MMTNKEISKILRLHAQLMELHGENSFKYRSYQNAAVKIDKIDKPLAETKENEMALIDGLGAAICSKISKLVTEGTFDELNKFIEKTPAGIIEILRIKGIGPKKVGVLWKELGVESPGELLYACNENRLIDLKGFGKKTQDQIIHALLYALKNKGKILYSTAEVVAAPLLKDLRNDGVGKAFSVTGEMRRKCNVVDNIEILIATDDENEVISFLKSHPVIHPLEEIIREESILKFNSVNGIKINIIICKPEEFYFKLFVTTGNEAHVSSFNLEGLENVTAEEEIYIKHNRSFVEPEMREGQGEIELAGQNKLPVLITKKDIKGIIHNHSTYSDGVNTLAEMAEFCKKEGYEYFAICDHSRSAFYANGLNIERVMQQHHEIEELNKRLAPFKILKGIESDILNDGSLDYPDEILSTFDLIVASIHSNLRMDKEKATNRLIRAIENPYTTILGHPTGRLLLAREGYQIDHQKIIDACAENNVVIELNANPYRLDMDWRWIGYALEKGVMISINPDAHSVGAIYMVNFGVNAARKGGLTKQMTFNALPLNEIEQYLAKKRSMDKISL